MPNTNFKHNLEEAIKKHSEGAVIMMELPTDNYFGSNIDSIKLLTSKGFEGIYVSFQRPFSNIEPILSKQGIDTKKLFFIDVASAMNGEEREGNSRCIHISDEIEIDQLVRAIYLTLPKLKGKKKFVFID